MFVGNSLAFDFVNLSSILGEVTDGFKEKEKVITLVVSSPRGVDDVASKTRSPLCEEHCGRSRRISGVSSSSTLDVGQQP